MMSTLGLVAPLDMFENARMEYTMDVVFYAGTRMFVVYIYVDSHCVDFQ